MECPFELRLKDNNPNLYTIHYKKKDVDILTISPRVEKLHDPLGNFDQHFNPYFTFIDGIWYVIYLGTHSYPVHPNSGWPTGYLFPALSIIRINLSYYLSNILDSVYDNLSLNIYMNIIRYFDIPSITDAINIQKHRGGISFGISPDKRLYYVETYDGYNAVINFYSLKTFKKLNTPQIPEIFTTHNTNKADIYYKDGIIVCSSTENYCKNIGKWDFPKWSYENYSVVLEDYPQHNVSVDDIVSGKAGIKENYYTESDINILRNLDIFDPEEDNPEFTEYRTVERYQFKYIDETDSLQIIEHFIDKDFYEIFPRAINFSNDYR